MNKAYRLTQKDISSLKNVLLQTTEYIRVYLLNKKSNRLPLETKNAQIKKETKIGDSVSLSLFVVYEAAYAPKYWLERHSIFKVSRMVSMSPSK